KSEKAVRLYEKTILPAADANVKSAQAAYTTGKTPFLSLIEAQRNLINLRDRYYETVADYFRRWATLDRVIGGPVERSAEWPAGRGRRAPARLLFLLQLQPAGAPHPVETHGQENVHDLIGDEQPAEYRQGHRRENLPSHTRGENHREDGDDRHT